MIEGQGDYVESERKCFMVRNRERIKEEQKRER